MKKLVFLSLLYLFFTVGIYAQAVSAIHKVSPTTATIGDIHLYEICVTFNRDINLVYPNVTESSDIFKTLEYEKQEIDIDEEKRLYRLTQKIAIFKTGKVEIPTLNIRYLENNEEKELILKPISVTIQSLLPKDRELPDIYDIKEPIRTVLNWKSILLWSIVIIAIVFLLSSLIYFYIKKRQLQQSEEPETVTDHRTPREIALDRLKNLSSKQLIKQDRLKEHYLELSEILKEYFSKVFSYKMMDMTTEEIVEYFLGSSIDETTFKRIRKTFEFSDLVKFAKFKPSDDDHNDAWKRAHDLIDRIPKGNDS